MSDDLAGDLKLYRNQIKKISKEVFLSQITRGRVPGQPPFLIFHLQTLKYSAELIEQLEIWKDGIPLQAFFDIEQVEEEELDEYLNVSHLSAGPITN